MNIKNTRLIIVPEIVDPRGNLCFVEEGRGLPFAVRRTFWTYNVPTTAIRAGHAHRRNEQLHVCVSGSVTFQLDDGKNREEIVLDHPSKVLYTGPMVWHWLKNWKEGTALLVLNSIKYEEEEYVRSYQEFLEMTR